MKLIFLALLVIALGILFSWPYPANLDQLKGKRILLTGGGSGIGEEIARIAYNQGAIVTIVGRRQNRLDKVCKDLQAENPSTPSRCIPLVGDMAVKNDVHRVVTSAVQKMNGGLDALILNHAWGVVKFFEDVKFDELEEVYNLTYGPNILGNLWLLNLCLPHLKASKQSNVFFYMLVVYL